MDEGRRGRERIEIARETDRRRVEGKGRRRRRRVSRGDVYQNNKILFFSFLPFPFLSSQILKYPNGFHLFPAGVRTSSEARGGDTEDHLETMRTTAKTHSE